MTKYICEECGKHRPCRVDTAENGSDVPPRCLYPKRCESNWREIEQGEQGAVFKNGVESGFGEAKFAPTSCVISVREEDRARLDRLIAALEGNKP